MASRVSRFPRAWPSVPSQSNHGRAFGSWFLSSPGRSVTHGALMVVAVLLAQYARRIPGPCEANTGYNCRWLSSQEG